MTAYNDWTLGLDEESVPSLMLNLLPDIFLQRI